jgi:hypothetical protein
MFTCQLGTVPHWHHAEKPMDLRFCRRSQSEAFGYELPGCEIHEIAWAGPPQKIKRSNYTPELLTAIADFIMPDTVCR